jgi:hypothetical protein
MTTIVDSIINGTVVANGAFLSVMVLTPVLRELNACRVRFSVDGKFQRALAMNLGDGMALLLTKMSDCGRSSAVGTVLQIQDLEIIPLITNPDRLRLRLLRLAEASESQSLSNRGARHALLFILEARDPLVRRERLEFFQRALSALEQICSGDHI